MTQRPGQDADDFGADHHRAGNAAAKNLRCGGSKPRPDRRGGCPAGPDPGPVKRRGQRRPVTVKVALIVACEESPVYTSICPGSTTKSPWLS